MIDTGIDLVIRPRPDNNSFAVFIKKGNELYEIADVTGIRWDYKLTFGTYEYVNPKKFEFSDDKKVSYSYIFKAYFNRRIIRKEATRQLIKDVKNLIREHGSLTSNEIKNLMVEKNPKLKRPNYLTPQMIGRILKFSGEFEYRKASGIRRHGIYEFALKEEKI